ncbi:hypothetical protein P8452_14533 [Trifolium repens]|nr:hypothetical protein QL285_010417 [Trifolium repens]WJX25499.1 hypothetical protein P8452_14533 [Trifolium repens]
MPFQLTPLEPLKADQVDIQCSQSKLLQLQSSQPKPIPMDNLDDNSSQDLSASADFDPLNATNLTPSQRSPAKANDDDILTGQQSSTRLIKTRSTKIKTEKP